MRDKHKTAAAQFEPPLFWFLWLSPAERFLRLARVKIYKQGVEYWQSRWLFWLQLARTRNPGPSVGPLATSQWNARRASGWVPVQSPASRAPGLGFQPPPAGVDQELALAASVFLCPSTPVAGTPCSLRSMDCAPSTATLGLGLTGRRGLLTPRPLPPPLKKRELLVYYR